MSFPVDLFDIEEILAPVTEEAPAGQDLRLDVSPQSLYFRLRDARAEARAEERRADNDPTADTGVSRHWKVVRDLALEALTKSGKDIEIAAWLTESLVRSDGLTGLAAGARVLEGLVKRFWNDGLFPLPDEDGIEGRVAPVAGLNGQGGDGTLMQPLRKLEMFARPDGTPVAFWQFDQAEEVAGLTDEARKTSRAAAGVPVFADLEAEAKAGGNAALAGLGQGVVRALDAWRALEEALQTAAGAEAPPTRRVRDLLEKLRRIIERYVTLAAEAPPEPEAPALLEAGPASAAIVAAAPAAPSREQMLGEIARIAAFFRTSEPNSPLSHTLDEAVRRARLSWPELLKEMMPDLPARSAVLSSLGIKPPTE
ncbi:MAG TPA: type VI secretion system protein TssA [Aliidongia sp.]|nr:type VI secretion system protein TssA [Aliidongia sp.]